jgi:hypothetical protein
MINHFFVGCTIAFSICNKPFKPIGLLSRRLKSREGLQEMTPTNIMQDHVIHKIEVAKNNDSHSLVSLTKYTSSSQFQGIKN